MTQDELNGLIRNVLESNDDDERQVNLNTLAENTRTLIKDYDTVLGERDDYKEKYDKANQRSIDLFMQVQGDKKKFKDDSENLLTNPESTMKKDREEDKEENMSYDSLLNDMKGELF